MINITNLRKSKTETNKGITLIALVITIIVLLILAGVSIATLTGENGILKKADTAKNQTTEAEEKEQINLAYTTIVADKLHNNERKDVIISADELQKELTNQNVNTTATDKDSKQIEVTFNTTNNKYTIEKETGKITGPTNSGGQTPTEPEYNTATTVKDAITQDKPFKEQTPIADSSNKTVTIPADFKIASDSAETIAEGVVIEDRNGNQFVWVPVDNIANFKAIEGYTEGSLQDRLTNCTEPFASGYSTETNEYNTMKQSVKDNHGFYIGRFEAGKDSNGNVVVKKGANVYNNVPWGNAMNDIEGTSNTGGKVGAVKLSKEFASKNNYTGVTSTLCYGVQWDATMQFMDSNYINGNCAENSYVRNSTNKGHYGASSPTTTGSKPEYAEKNIYDMAGNVWEWIMEAYYTDRRVDRGGGYNYSSSNAPVSHRGYDKPDFACDGIGFRIALYL